MELGVPLIVALNMIDVAAGQGLHIDAVKLAESLGVPVVPIQANKKIGLDRLREAIALANGGGPPPGIPHQWVHTPPPPHPPPLPRASPPAQPPPHPAPLRPAP